MDRRAWRTTVYRVAESQTRLKQLSEHALLAYEQQNERQGSQFSALEFSKLSPTLQPFPCNLSHWPPMLLSNAPAHGPSLPVAQSDLQ